MLLRTVSIILVLSLLASSSSASVGEESQKQTFPEMRKVALKAVEKNRQLTVVLKTKRDGKKKFTGTPSNVSEQGFTLIDKSSGQRSQVDFEDVRELRMKGSHLGLYLGIAVVAAAVLLTAFALSKIKSD
jgi:hypothetical protein